MEFKIILKKASSLKELGYEVIQIDDVQTLRQLLCALSYHEYNKQKNKEVRAYTLQEIQSFSHLGKVTFENYNQNQIDLYQSIETMYTDFQDGLFRVYLNQNECLDLDESLNLHESNEVVIIKLVMLAGRLW